jgi:threonine synthase
MDILASPLHTRAVRQRSLGPGSPRYPLLPPLTAGCPQTSTPEISYPVEVEFDLPLSNPGSLFAQKGRGLERFAALLPPLAEGLSMAEGGTPLVDITRKVGGRGQVLVKNEALNPTWSHKDRLNLCAVSAAVQVGAPGVVVASSGNHAVSAAAYAARTSLGCLVVTTTGMSPSVKQMLVALGAAIVAVPVDSRWSVLRDIVKHTGYHPVSNLTPTHTGHAWGPEGYKTIAYEIFADLGNDVPSALLVPTGYGEMLFGIAKGFCDLHRLGLARRIPRLFSVEPEARGPLHAAMQQARPVASVDSAPTSQIAIACTVGGVRGTLALAMTDGAPLKVTDGEATRAQQLLAQSGLWFELSSAVGLAAVSKLPTSRDDGPVVIIGCSSGLKEPPVAVDLPELAPEFSTIARHVRDRYGVVLT